MAPLATLDLTGFKLTFDDEGNTFSSNGPSDPGNAGHTGTWDTTLSYDERKLNDEVQLYTDPTIGGDPITASGGTIDIHAAPADHSSQAWGYGGQYTSGMMTTYHSFSQKYGYFEMRAQLPEGAGMWPAFWLLPTAHVWPPELDPMEAFGDAGSGDGGAYSFHNGLVPITGSGPGGWNDTGGANLYTQQNTFGVDWEADTITYYLNGKAYQTVATPAGFDQPMYMLANLAVGGNWAGAPLGESADMKIDYIRAYSRDGANPAVAQQAISSPDGRGYSFAGATDANGDGPLGGVDAAPPPPTSPATPPPAPSGDQYTGQGAHDLTLQVDEDAWHGDAQFVVLLDGAVVGGVMSTSASRSAGQTQAFHILNDAATGRHELDVRFLNDASSDSGDDRGDRNLFVASATQDGAPIAGAQLSEYRDGQQGFTFVQGDLAAAQAAVAPVAVGAGPDTIALDVSEDAWQGDAQFSVAVDGSQVGGTLTASVAHGSGLHQRYMVQGAFGPGTHQVAVTFLNDAWGGNGAMDRNMYVDAATYNGSDPAGTAMALLSDGTQTETVGVPVPAPAQSLAPAAAPAQQAFARTDTSTLSSDGTDGDTYAGPLHYLQRQMIWQGTDGVAAVANTPSVFLHGGPADDALTVTGGSNVLDGGGGSNFLVGAVGAGPAGNTFFVDGRGGAETWSTVVGFSQGDHLTLWGFVPGQSDLAWTDGEGTAGYTGATLRSHLPGSGGGAPMAATFAGLTTADVQDRMTVTTGTVEGNSYLNVAFTG